MKPAAPSRTAEYMALFRALETSRPAGRRLFADRSATAFLSPPLRAVARAARVPLLRGPIIAFIDRRWPGPRLSGVVRTRVIDDFVTDALSAGCTQLVLLGAGYDTRATRLPAAAAVAVFEVDHPTTQQRKRDALDDASGHVRYVPVDFETDSLPGALTAAGLDRDRRSCVVWEGVFSYLTPAAIDRTLEALVQVSGPGSQILLTYVDARCLEGSSDQPHAWMKAVRDAGEPFQTGLHPDEAPAFFTARHLPLRRDESTTEAAIALGLQDAHTIPDIYRLATLEVGLSTPQE